jgi:hypothetical protein
LGWNNFISGDSIAHLIPPQLASHYLLVSSTWWGSGDIHPLFFTADRCCLLSIPSDFPLPARQPFLSIYVEVLLLAAAHAVKRSLSICKGKSLTMTPMETDNLSAHRLYHK